MKNKVLFFILTITSLQVPAQLSRMDAIELVVTEIIGVDSITYKHLCSKYDTLFISEYLVLANLDTIYCSYPQAWAFFIDDAPPCLWAHACRYVFVNIENGEYTIHQKTIHPQNYYLSIFFENWEFVTWTSTIFYKKLKQDFSCLAFPNPFINNLLVKTNLKGKLILQITNLSGGLIHIQDFICSPENQNELNLNLSTLSPGVYLLQIKNDKQEISVQKIIKYP